MKKSSFVALILGTLSGVLFALGMCMALLPEWHAFTSGIICGSIGIVLGIITLARWRKMEKKAPIKVNAKTLLGIILGAFGAIILGVGMCLCLVSENFIIGIPVGLAGIVILLCLLPYFKGFKDDEEA